jgi:GNAT superfamily N-acetyltransferase
MTVNPSSAVRALVDSLCDDPFYVAITEEHSGDEVRRRDALGQYFDYSLSEGARIGRCVIASDGAPAAAVWLLPTDSTQRQAESRAKAAFLSAALGHKGAQNYHRIIEFMSPRAQSLVSSAAWYLSIVGVSPAAQGQGVGARLLKGTLTEADDVGAQCYLETFSARNLLFYGRLGFKVLASYEEPITSAEYFIMHRMPDA